MEDLTHYITNKFFEIRWSEKLLLLDNIISGLKNIHDANIIHKDYHRNVFITSSKIFAEGKAITGDLGISKSAIESIEDNNEVYGIIPYVAPEILQGQKYTKASDIYSFSMVMWELMTGRKPFWDQNHDTGLIIKICDGFRPPIVTNAPVGYVELMQECWHPDPDKRPTAINLMEKIKVIKYYDWVEVVASPDIGPIENNPGAVYKSRLLSTMIESTNPTGNLKSQIVTSEIGE